MTWCFPSDFEPEEYIGKIFSAIAADPYPERSLMNGFAGIAHTLQLLNHRFGLLEESTLGDFYHYIRKFIILDVHTSNFDLLNGYLGQCYSLIQQSKSEENFEVLQAATENLASLAIRGETGIGWMSELELKIRFPEWKDHSTPPKVWNLGLAHGNAGIIITLARLAAAYPELAVEELIQNALQGLQSAEFSPSSTHEDYYYSAFSGMPHHQPRPGQLSWCHSDLGIGTVYFMLWEITGNKAHLEKAEKLLMACTKKGLDHSGVRSSGLCHGAAGVAHLFNRMYQKTKQPEYRERAIYWYNQLFDNFLEPAHNGGFIRGKGYNKVTNAVLYIDDGFLEGLIGIGLSIHAATQSAYPHWDSLLML
jgi:lantibiotic biosynthesis protein